MSTHSKLPLSTNQLLSSGFLYVARWISCTVNGIRLDKSVQNVEGVYAFAINGTVVYVGVASQSLATRMGGYCKPGSSQSTNKRLKAKIMGALEQGAVIDVYFASPCDFVWNDLPVSGICGLERGLIRHFCLLWNMQGT